MVIHYLVLLIALSAKNLAPRQIGKFMCPLTVSSSYEWEKQIPNRKKKQTYHKESK